jgi:DUF4097 and DUF4098 domain-containing protein YvlB
MRRRFPVQLIALLALTCACAYGEEWKKEFTTSGKLTLRVETNDAEIRITSWDRKETEARVITTGYKIGPGDVRVTDRQSGDQVELEVHTPRLSGLILRSHSVRIEISMPREADLNLHTGDGNIRVEDIKGALRLDSGDGNLEVRSADGRLNADTHDGNIRAQGRFDGLDLHTGDGNIDAEAGSGSKDSSGWVLRTGDGNVALRVPQDFSADLDAQTGDGHVNIDFPVTVTGSMRGNSTRGKMNGGGQPLELRTGDGDIELGKS